MISINAISVYLRPTVCARLSGPAPVGSASDPASNNRRPGVDEGSEPGSALRSAPLQRSDGRAAMGSCQEVQTPTPTSSATRCTTARDGRPGGDHVPQSRGERMMAEPEAARAGRPSTTRHAGSVPGGRPQRGSCWRGRMASKGPLRTFVDSRPCSAWRFGFLDRPIRMRLPEGAGRSVSVHVVFVDLGGLMSLRESRRGAVGRGRCAGCLGRRRPRRCVGARTTLRRWRRGRGRSSPRPRSGRRRPCCGCR